MVNSKVAFGDYLEKEKKYSVLTLRAYIDDLNSFEEFINRDGSLVLEEADYNQIRNWIVFLVERGLSNNSINRKIASLKAFYKFLLYTKQIEVNPLQKHKALKTAKNVQVPFSEAEMTAVFERFDTSGFEGIRDRLVVELFYATGMRRTELINLKINNYDAFAKTLKVLGKRNKERLIPLLGCTNDLIKKYLEYRGGLQGITDSDMLILNLKGNKVSESFVYRLINSYFSSISVKLKRSPHVLRHTFATHLLNNGADLNSVKELLGHASLSSTQIYTHNSLAGLKEVYKKAHPRGSGSS